MAEKTANFYQNFFFINHFSFYGKKIQHYWTTQGNSEPNYIHIVWLWSGYFVYGRISSDYGMLCMLYRSLAMIYLVLIETGTLHDLFFVVLTGFNTFD